MKIWYTYIERGFLKIIIEMIIILVFFTELKHDAFKYKFHVLEKQYKTSIRVNFVQQNFSYFLS